MISYLIGCESVLDNSLDRDDIRFENRQLTNSEVEHIRDL